VGWALLAQGCKAQRTITIRSDPPGARVRIDDRALGITPVQISFQYYGIRRITLYKDGYRSHSEQIRLAPPWYARFPIDFFTEVLLPLGIDDHRTCFITLTPGEEVTDIPSLRSVIERADVLREAGPEGPRHLPEPRPRIIPRRETQPEAEDTENKDAREASAKPVSEDKP
jgi:hypothetical protein